MNGTRQVLAYADDVNFTGNDIRTIERNPDLLSMEPWAAAKKL